MWSAEMPRRFRRDQENVGSLFGPGPRHRTALALKPRVDCPSAMAAFIRLETNESLREAQALYRSSGYREVPPFNSEPYAHHWFEKNLTDANITEPRSKVE